MGRLSNHVSNNSHGYSLKERPTAKQIQEISTGDFLTIQEFYRRFSTIGQSIANWMKQGLAAMGLLQKVNITAEQFSTVLNEYSTALGSDQADDSSTGLTFMRARARIIVEKSGKQWLAWFAETPRQLAIGKIPADAIRELVELFTIEIDFKTNEISSIDSATTDNHFEFSIPRRRLRRVPQPSPN